MNKLHLSIAFAVSAGLAVPAFATAAPGSSLAESRGYQNCRAAAERSVDLLTLNSKYYINEGDSARQYYLNGFARIDGVTTPVKIDCQTTVSGHRLGRVNVSAGEFIGRMIDHTVVAGTD